MTLSRRSLNALVPPPTPRWQRTASGAALAIDLDTVKDFIARPREDTFWDAELTSFVKVATKAIEDEFRLSLTADTFLVTVPLFDDLIRLTKFRPFVSVTGIEYVRADDGEILTVDPTLYHALTIDQECGGVFLGDGKAWPSAAIRQDAVRITVKAGFASSEAEVTDGYPERPEEITHALLMTIAALDKARGDTQASAGSNTTVYAMKMSKGGNIIPIEARTLIAEWRYLWVTV